MWVSSLFLWSVSLAVFWLLDVLSCRLENTCSIMTENPYKATHFAHRMTTAVLRFARKEVQMLHGREPYSVTLKTPLLCNVCCLTPVIMHFNIIKSSHIQHFYIWFLGSSFSSPVLRENELSTTVYKWCFDPALLLFPFWIKNLKKHG